ncbi:DUF5667 domain-containing protein [Nonomuraea pusilla]|uniref:DUF5667 domain-containing protein n=1 Tax=Nonomuraea pusilla TaxID=46177 RepID=UPI0033178F25
MGRARRRRERVLEHLTELRALPLGGGPDPAFRNRLRDALVSGLPLAPDHPSAPSIEIPTLPRSLADAVGGGPLPADTARRLLDDTARRLVEGEPAAEGAGHGRAGRPRRRRAPRRQPLLYQLASFGLAAAMTLSAFATYRSVPGDTLYPLKRAAESTLVQLSIDDAERGERELDSARTRAKEVASLLGSSRDDRLVSKTLKDMDDSTRSGINRLERAEPRSPKIKNFARDQRDMVEPMLDQLDEAQQGQAAGYLDYIEGLVAPAG